MLIKNTNNYNVTFESKDGRTYTLMALREMEIDESNVLKFPAGVIRVDKKNLLVEPNLYDKTLDETPVDTSKLLLEAD